MTDVTVKPLVWEQVSDRCWDADGMGKLYRVMARDGGAVIRHSHLDREGERFESVEAAKAASQADYAARILSALTPAPREDGYSAGVRAALPAMERCLSRLDDLPVKHPQQASDKAAFRAALRALAGQPPV